MEKDPDRLDDNVVSDMSLSGQLVQGRHCDHYMEMPLKDILRRKEREILEQVLDAVPSNLSEVARRLHLSRPAVYRLIKSHKLEHKIERQGPRFAAQPL
jgi:DNA-binding NtrC family response regulator